MSKIRSQRLFLGALVLTLGVVAAQRSPSLAQAHSMNSTMQNAPTGLDPVKALSEENVILKKRVTQLESEVSTLDEDVKNLKLRTTAHPIGRSRMIITKGNFNQVPDDAIMEFWVKS